jgi:hypothetical protein
MPAGRDPEIMAAVHKVRAGLTISELREACRVLLDEAERRHGAEFNLLDAGHDYYWHLDLTAAFDLTESPEQHVDCGQVSDDAAEVAALLRGGESISLWHDLEHVVGLLRLLALLDLPNNP